MKKSIVISQIFTIILAFSVIIKAQTISSVNVLKQHNPTIYKNWTDQFSWSAVTVATEVEGLVKSQNVIDSLKLIRTLNRISKQKGGVLLFPKGTYFVNHDILLPEGVIISGEVNQVGEGNYTILTKFEFPKYIIKHTPNAQYNLQSRIYESSDIRKISVLKGSKGNIGIINLDINRGLIDLQNSDNQLLKNILVVNVSQNNVAVADDRVPSIYQKANYKEYQRWVQKDVPNMRIIAEKNVIVANCRFNEKITDNIPQMEYLTNDGLVFDAFEATYKFTDHTGIVIELSKSSKNSEIVGNYLRVTEGNVLIQTKGIDLVDGKNDVGFIKEKQNLVRDGLYAKDASYSIFQQENPRLLKDTFLSKFGDTLDYSLVTPKTQIAKGKYPLVVFLETGSPQNAQNGDQLKQFPWQVTDEGNAQQFPCFTLAPQLPKSEDWWKSKSFSSTTWMLRTVIQMIDSLSAKYPIDTDRIYLVGVGLGAIGAWDLAQRYPQKFAALIPISSFYRFVPNSALQLKNMPIWMIWGESDEYMPLTTKQFMKYELKSAGIKYKSTEIPNTGNRCWTALDQTVPDLFSWIFQQKLQ